MAATRDAGPTFRVRSPRGVAHVLRAPGQLGLGRAYVSGELEVDDLDALVEVVDGWRPPALSTRSRVRLILAAARAGGAVLPSPAPSAELRPRGALHSRDRDARAVRHHYDVSNEFFALFLDRSMTYSCAFFSRGGDSLQSAQEAKLELTCRKLRVEAGSDCSTSAAGGAASPSMPPRATGRRSWGSRFPSHRPPWPGRACARRDWTPA